VLFWFCCRSLSCIFVIAFALMTNTALSLHTSRQCHPYFIFYVQRRKINVLLVKWIRLLELGDLGWGWDTGEGVEDRKRNNFVMGSLSLWASSGKLASHKPKTLCANNKKWEFFFPVIHKVILKTYLLFISCWDVIQTTGVLMSGQLWKQGWQHRKHWFVIWSHKTHFRTVRETNCTVASIFPY